MIVRFSLDVEDTPQPEITSTVKIELVVRCAAKLIIVAIRNGHIQPVHAKANFRMMHEPVGEVGAASKQNKTYLALANHFPWGSAWNALLRSTLRRKIFTCA